ncbi:hypothetical protein FOZ63_011953, partial [Perkinsus olseni]
GSIEPSQTLPSELIIKAPIGFTISQDCITDITVESSAVFGDADYWPSWSSSYQRWPNDGTARILGCKAGSNTASITISPGLQANGKKYVLRIAVISVSYPIPYDQNLWVVSLKGKQSSLPFPGYRLSTFTDITLVSASTAATLLRPVTSLTGLQEVLIRLTFTPTNSISPYEGNPMIDVLQGITSPVDRGGILKIITPPEFTWVSGLVGRTCPSLSYDTRVDTSSATVTSTETIATPTTTTTPSATTTTTTEDDIILLRPYIDYVCKIDDDSDGRALTITQVGSKSIQADR